MDGLPSYEKLGSFYLGKNFDLGARKVLDEMLLYDAKDLTTHAMCVGMTGSGKTGLCLALLEEAAIDGIPAIAIDPKGDLGNLLLAFPDLAPSDFQKWLEPSEAARQGMSIEKLSEKTAATWRAGLEQWGQDAARIKRYRDAVDVAIYTPGSNAGLPMTVLKSFDAPPQAVIDDTDVMRERVAGAASGLLTLLGMEVDPLSSREHILLSNIFDSVWRKGQNLDLVSLIRLIQTPPLSKIGVFDLESFLPSTERMKLAMSLNNLHASPSFAGWLEGQPLDIKKLLYTSQGKPRLSIISIAHLSDAERMFFVTIMLNELLGWMRTQPGTGSLRAIFYMDEVFGYFPPSAKPPSKPPMLVLLKQARAFGLGIVLATQNPVDLDYKGLSNIGTWFLGRLQTQRDKDRVLEGLEGAALQTGSKFDRGMMEQTLAALGSRVFLMNNVHDDAPTIFQSRWALSFLRGPFSRQQIQELMDKRKADEAPQPGQTRTSQADSATNGAVAGTATMTSAAPTGTRPILPNTITERFWVPARIARKGSRHVYRPALLANAACHYVRAGSKTDVWQDMALLVMADRKLEGDVWESSKKLAPNLLELSQQPDDEIAFADLPDELIVQKKYKTWEKSLSDYLYRHEPLRLYSCAELKATSQPGQDELDARMGWTQQIRELRDAEKAKLQDKYAKQIKALESKIVTATQKLEREKAEYDREKYSSVMSIGTTILGALVGRKIGSISNVTRTTSAARNVGRAAQQRTDVLQATDTLESLEQEKRDLVEQCQAEVNELQLRFGVENLTLEALEIPCRKSDTRIDLLALLWVPWEIDSSGIATPLVELPKDA